MDIILFLAGVFLLTFLVGILLEKFNIPWIFSALLIGLGLAATNLFEDVTSSGSFHFLAQLGMFFLLFIIGFELDLKKIFGQGSFFIRATIVIILTETVFGSLLVHYIFNVPWLISGLVATSFATVGEAVLLPILDEFKLTKTKLGQTILGIGVLDDLVEILTIVVASVMIGSAAGHTQHGIGFDFLILASLFALVFLLRKIRKELDTFKFMDISSFFLFVIFIIFLFIGLGSFVEAGALGAIMAGIALKNIVPKDRLKFIDSEIRTMAYGFFAPIFFLWVGIDTDVGYLVRFPLLVLLVMAMTNSTKVISSFFVGRKMLGAKKSILLGIGLCVKFSTSIVVIKLLFDKGIIASDLYSVLVGTTIMFKFVVPFLLSFLIRRWKIGSYVRQGAS